MGFLLKLVILMILLLQMIIFIYPTPVGKSSLEEEVTQTLNITYKAKKRISGAEYVLCSDLFYYCTMVQEFIIIESDELDKCAHALHIQFLATNPYNETKLVYAFLWEHGSLSNSPNKYYQSNQENKNEVCKRSKM